VGRSRGLVLCARGRKKCFLLCFDADVREREGATVLCTAHVKCYHTVFVFFTERELDRSLIEEDVLR
jgi:hypothetical protein